MDPLPFVVRFTRTKEILLLRLSDVIFDLISLRTQATYGELQRLSFKTNLFKRSLFSDRKRLNRVEQCLVDKRVQAFKEENILFVRNALCGRHAGQRRVN